MRGNLVTVLLSGALILTGCSTTQVAPTVTKTIEARVEVQSTPEPTVAVVVSTSGVSAEIQSAVEDAVATGGCDFLQASISLVLAYEGSDKAAQGDAWNANGANRISTLVYLDDALRRASCY